MTLKLHINVKLLIAPLALPLALLTTNVSPCAAISTNSPISTHSGICDASGVVDLGNGEFAVADDELNLLLIYKSGVSGPAIYSTEISEHLEVIKLPTVKKKKQNTKKNKKQKETKLKQKTPKVKEVDIEGAARVGDVVYWISSHGRKKTGKQAQERMRLFATSIVQKDGKTELIPKGQSYSLLLEDLLADKRYEQFGLEAAAEKSPKSPGGFNIEALTDRPDGTLLIGFRSPLIEGKSLLVPLLNPSKLITGSRAEFGDPILLDLDGQGIRGLSSSISSNNTKYFIVANDPEGDDHTPALFTWNGSSTTNPKRVSGLTFGDFNPEAIAIRTTNGTEEVLLLSDDGSLQLGQHKCKDLKDHSLRRFRSTVFSHPELSTLNSKVAN